ncbi:MAG: EF2563 family selenium-dependent molybdenum hydroxylase system protein [Desulfatiglans sp.]|jgi:xanthine dehydrogenase accessory factor|nr:EF2563 family selenium-dependent molybdenum hydroxylase system protein [Desulfatiglans sp.]
MDKNKTILIKGAGEKASAVAWGLFSQGFRRIIMTDIENPLAERRGVCFSEAAFEQGKEIEGIRVERSRHSMDSINSILSNGAIPLLVSPDYMLLQDIRPDIIVDGIMAKRNTGTFIEQAPLVIALGPGFCAGRDVHYVIETNPNIPGLGTIIESGCAEEHTGIPTEVQGKSLERLLLSPGTGVLYAEKNIGDPVSKGDTIGYVGDKKLQSPIPGVVWGLIRTPANVKEGQKLGDIHPGSNREICFKITPQANKITASVIDAITRRYN